MDTLKKIALIAAAVIAVGLFAGWRLPGRGQARGFNCAPYGYAAPGYCWPQAYPYLRGGPACGYWSAPRGWYGRRSWGPRGSVRSWGRWRRW